MGEERSAPRTVPVDPVAAAAARVAAPQPQPTSKTRSPAVCWVIWGDGPGPADVPGEVLGIGSHIDDDHVTVAETAHELVAVDLPISEWRSPGRLLP
jgi:hypothetical protein